MTYYAEQMTTFPDNLVYNEKDSFMMNEEPHLNLLDFTDEEIHKTINEMGYDIEEGGIGLLREMELGWYLFLLFTFLRAYK